MKGIKTNQVVLNLGLGNNPYSMVEDIAELVNTTNLKTWTTSIKLVDGLYNGEVETTAVINCITANAKDIRQDIEKLCVLFTQERIALMVDNKRGAVIDHPFMNLNAMLFDEKYFIN
jgi:hypothetical protein